ncbi:MAG: hypothetical protein NHG36_10660, partial [Chromatiaceae bacterium]|nr:hypothetical protein [Candidatus Thioaporhodococcus sediminis]
MSAASSSISTRFAAQGVGRRARGGEAVEAGPGGHRHQGAGGLLQGQAEGVEVGALQGQQAGQAQLPADRAEGQARRLLQVPHPARRRARTHRVGEDGLELPGGLDQQGELPLQQPAEG